jgi:CRP/FNR family transcriptional regulator, cyclic AMP receptor protein
MYVERGAVRLSVLSHAGKEAVVALLDIGHFFGEGCLAHQSQRMVTATAMVPSTILAVEKHEMVRQLHAEPMFADGFLTHMLTRNIRIEEDLVDQLFNSTEKRLARTLLSVRRRRDLSESRRYGRARPRVVARSYFPVLSQSCNLRAPVKPARCSE